MHPRIVDARVQRPYLIDLRFSDGSTGSVDLARWIVGARGVFAALQDPSVFAQVRVDREAGTIVWPNGADLDPDVLFEAAQSDNSAKRR